MVHGGKRQPHFAFCSSGATTGRPCSYKHWDDDTLEKASKAVSYGMSIRRASEEYDIPRSTLHDHISGRIMFGAKSGPKSYLTPTEEDELVNFLSGMNSVGYSRTVKQIIEIVQAACDAKGIHVKVSPSWWKSFKGRHDNLVLRIPERLTHSRVKGVSHTVIENYFYLLEETLHQSEMCDRPCQIFNLDESGFPLNPKPSKVVCCKGSKHPSSIVSAEKSQMTVLACCSAGGQAIPPLVIYDRKTLKPELTLGGTMYGLSDNGWMDWEIFEAWFINRFLVYAPPARPILLLMDGHSSHFSPLFVNKAAEEKIIVFCLPPNSTHKTQPLDKGVFGPLKKAWTEQCHSYLLKNPGKVVTRYQFSLLFGQAWMQAMTPNNIISGFRVTGVYPVNCYKILPTTPSKSPTICERTGLKFVPLLTPIRSSLQSRRVSSQHPIIIPPLLSSESQQAEIESLLLTADFEPFSDEENALFTRRDTIF